MVSMLYPTTVVDNFLLQPNKYVSLANSLEYFADDSGRWPGVRSKNLSELFPTMVNKIVSNIMCLYYNPEHKIDNISWFSHAYFQKIKNIYGSGWVHNDPTQLTCIIYLCDEGLGTSLCAPKDVSTFDCPINDEKKIESYKNLTNISQFDQFKEENNKQFKKSISVDSQFNRLLVFESRTYHCADNSIISNKDDERLTLIIFIDNIYSNSFPILRSKRD